MEKLPISLVIITVNEQLNIAECIKSVPWVGEVLVLDSGSDDKTVEIAKALGAKVIIEEWRGFGPQKRRAVELSQYEWVLCLDADEVLSREASEELFNLVLTKQMTSDAYAFPRKTHHLGRWIVHGGWYPDYQVRFFRKTKCQWSNDILHEKVVGVRPGFFQYPIEHFAFEDLFDQVRTNNKYSSLGAQSLGRKKRKFHISNIIIKPLVKFIESFIFKKGFKDGIPGYIIAVGAAYSVFLKYAKLWELTTVSQKSKLEDIFRASRHENPSGATINSQIPRVGKLQ